MSLSLFSVVSVSLSDLAVALLSHSVVDLSSAAALLSHSVVDLGSAVALLSHSVVDLGSAVALLSHSVVVSLLDSDLVLVLRVLLLRMFSNGFQLHL